MSATALPAPAGTCPPRAAAHHPQVGDRRRQPLGHVDHDPRVGVERLGLALVCWSSGLSIDVLIRRLRTSTVTVALVGAAHDRELELRRRARRVERLVERVDPVELALPAATIRSPRSRPARSAALPSSTPRTSRPSRSGRPTARRRRRATRGGAIATPSRARCGASPRPSASTRSRSAASAGIARIRPPSTRTELMPSSRPSVSTSGPPEEPRGSGAVCSIAPRDPAAARAAEAAGGRGDEAGRDAQAAPARVGEREHRRGRSRPARASSDQCDRLDLAGVDARSRRGRGRRRRRPPARPRAAVGEGDRDLVVAQVVGVGQHPARGDHDAEPTPQPRPRPTTAGPIRSAAA